METFTHISYLIIKVLILIITELVIFPITCGCWLDVCSLTLVGTSLSSRLKTFHSYPISSTILHWLAGMLYVLIEAFLLNVICLGLGLLLCVFHHVSKTTTPARSSVVHKESERSRIQSNQRNDSKSYPEALPSFRCVNCSFLYLSFFYI